MLNGIQSSPSFQGSVVFVKVELSTAVPFPAMELLLLAGEVVLSVSVRVKSDVLELEPDGPGTSEVIVVVIVESVPFVPFLDVALDDAEAVELVPSELLDVND